MSDNTSLIFENIMKHGYVEIKKMIDEPQAENLWIDFKQKTDPDGSVKLSKSDKENFAKGLSGFANAAGGVLIWGVDSRTDGNGQIVNTQTPISNLSSFHQGLESLTPEAVSRVPEGLRIEKILLPGEKDNGFLVVYVPESIYAPHRAEFHLHTYYRRIGDSFREMDHSQIEDMFGRRQRPSLELKVDFNKVEIKPEIHRYLMLLKLINTGRVMCRYYGIDLFFPTEAVINIDQRRPQFSAPRPVLTGMFQQNDKIEKGMTLISYRNGQDEPPMFPGEELLVNLSAGRIEYKVDQRIYEKYDNLIAKARVYADNAPIKMIDIPFNEFHVY